MKYLLSFVFVFSMLAFPSEIQAQKGKEKRYENLKIQIGKEIYRYNPKRPISLKKQDRDLRRFRPCGADPAAFDINSIRISIIDHGEEFGEYIVMAIGEVKNVGHKTFKPGKSGYTAKLSVGRGFRGRVSKIGRAVVEERLPALRPGESFFLPSAEVARGRFNVNEEFVIPSPLMTLSIQPRRNAFVDPDCNSSNNLLREK